MIRILIFAGILLTQPGGCFAQSPKPVKHPKWHKFVHKVDTTAKITGEVALTAVIVSAVVLASDGIPIQVR